MNKKLNTLINCNIIILYSKSVPTKECALFIFTQKTTHLHFAALRRQLFINYVHKKNNIILECY